MAIPKLHEDFEDTLNKSLGWTTTYGDFMSNLMIFFLALFAFYVTTNINDKATVHNTKNIIVESTSSTNRMTSSIRKPYIVVTLKKPVLLRYDKAEVRKGIKETLSQVEDELVEAYTVNFEGEMNKPDRRGLYPANWVKKVTINISPDLKNDSEYYVVRDGDNLWTIAQKYAKDGILYDDLATLNNVKDAKSIHKGDILVIPSDKALKELRKKKRGDMPIIEIAKRIKNALFSKRAPASKTKPVRVSSI